MKSISSQSLDQKLTRLANMDASELRDEWQKRFGHKPAPRLGRDLLIRASAYKVQEKVFGGLSKMSRRKLASYRQQMETGGSIAVVTDIRIKPGTKLIREWNGKVHTVVALEKGFEHNGQRYASLSKIAREITGSHWSGPLFFGLKKRPTPPGVSRHG